MLRGKRKLKDISTSVAPELFQETKEEIVLSDYEKKVELLTARYYYYLAVNKQGNIVLILEKLQKEFFISSNQITNIIEKNTDSIKQLRAIAPKPDWFKSKWSHIVW